MFKKLFGGGSGGGAPAQAQKPAPVDPTQTIEKLEQQCETVNKRIKVLENRIKDAKATALAKKKSGDNRGALLSMKQMKMYEGELTKLDGQMIMLEQQKMVIQSTAADVDVIKTLGDANKAIGNMNKQMDVDTIEDLRADMEENMEEVNARQELFAEAAAEGQDELLAELDELEAEAIEGEMADMEISNMPIAAPAQPVAQPAQAAAAQEEVKASNDLAAMMAL